MTNRHEDEIDHHRAADADDAVTEALGRLEPGDLHAGIAPPLNPAVQVVRGRPDEIELAALVAGIVAARGAHEELGGLPDDAAPGMRSRWTDPARVLGLPPAPGVGSWRWSLHR